MKNSTILVPCQLEKQDRVFMVCDSTNHRTQVFKLCGKFVTKFGSKVSERGEFMFPSSTANPTDAEGYSDTRNFPVTLI